MQIECDQPRFVCFIIRMLMETIYIGVRRKIFYRNPSINNYDSERVIFLGIRDNHCICVLYRQCC